MEISFFSLQFWLVLAVVCVLFELITLTFFLLSIAIGSAVAALVNYLGFDPYTQILVFAIVTVVCIILSRSFAKKLSKSAPDKKANSDRLIGLEAIVSEAIEEDKMGTVELVGDKWKAIADEDIAIGEKVIVKDIQGVKLIVEKMV
ncbi:MAG: NfeD family protein [Methanobrevibacter sp.]|jgi:membrane protein implicated in regulation of membrane protease activity|nr:NfeD family protein [Methanobrevibacter sp.]